MSLETMQVLTERAAQSTTKDVAGAAVPGFDAAPLTRRAAVSDRFDCRGCGLPLPEPSGVDGRTCRNCRTFHSGTELHTQG